ncbi:MAG: VWA domain-containing protein [DPANN group archaeon]|nr:VWA domain-containing protein [DPANN group archaeon]
MYFEEPFWLSFLVLLPIIYYIYHLSLEKNRLSAIKFSDIRLIKTTVSKHKNWFRNNILLLLKFLAFTSVIFALADPQVALLHREEGVNIVLAIDISGSMVATDYTPNRIEAAKRNAELFVQNLNLNDRVGIIVFSDGATAQSFFTTSKDRTLASLKNIKVSQGMTAIGDGLALSVDMVTSNPSKKKFVILLSDGVNNAGVISINEAIEFANSQDIQVFTIGMGSNGQVVLGYDFFGRPMYAEFDEVALQLIAQETNGEYFKSIDDNTLEDIYSSLSEKIERTNDETSTRMWFMFMSFIFILSEFYLRTVKYRVLS